MPFQSSEAVWAWTANWKYMLERRVSTIWCCQEALKLSGGRVDVLVNNAGVYYPMSFDEGPNKGQGPLDGALLHSLILVHSYKPACAVFC